MLCAQFVVRPTTRIWPVIVSGDRKPRASPDSFLSAALLSAASENRNQVITVRRRYDLPVFLALMVSTTIGGSVVFYVDYKRPTRCKS